MHSDDYKAFLALRKLSHAEAAPLFGATSKRTSEGWACGRAELPGHVTILLHLYTVMPEALARVQQLRAPLQAAPARQAPAKKGAKPRPTPDELWAICVKDIQDMSAPTPGFTRPFDMAAVRDRWRQALAYYNYPAPEKYPA